MKQEWNNYTNDDHEVWNILFERQVKNLQDKAWSEYLRCIPEAGINGYQVPEFGKVEQRLARTGWKIEVVKGIIPVQEFLELLSKKKFCSSTWLRKREQLDYLEEPDMFHDTFGHIPLLVNEQYANFVQQFAIMGLKFCDHEKAVMLLERLYWFTIEFGLMKEQEQLRIYGAGILSSFGESLHVYSDKVVLKKFNVRDVLVQPFHNNEVQELYFVVENMDGLWNSIHEIEHFLHDFLNGNMSGIDFQFEKQLGSAAMNK